MKKLFVATASMALSVCATAAVKPAPQLVFDASKGVAGSVTLPQGKTVNYTAYTNLYYVTNVEDSTYQYMNIYVPQGATQATPIFMRNYIGGYMAAKPQAIDAEDASGRALAEGYVVVIPGARGRNSVTEDKGDKIYTGRAPKGLLDLKAAVRYLRHFDKEIPGNAEKIISDGTSAGGAMSALLGASGNNPAYQQDLEDMGAANERDDIFAAVCYCPIVDLEHADMAYEWLYACTNNITRPLTPQQEKVSEELAEQFGTYLKSLNLKQTDGTILTTDNYRDYLKQFLIKSAQEAKDAGADIPDSIGFRFSKGQGTNSFAPTIQKLNEQYGPFPRTGIANNQNINIRSNESNLSRPQKSGEYITDLDLDKYLNYVVTTIALKTPPAFDSQGVAGAKASAENEVFGDESGNSVNFTDYSLQQATGNPTATIDNALRERVRIMNPMRMLDDPQSLITRHWYIRHGARDRDTAFPIPVNLATKLQNMGKEVNFKLSWNRPHSGDYALNELFAWIGEIVRE